MGLADERRGSPPDFHLFQIDRDLEDIERQFDSMRRHFDEEIGELKASVKNLSRIGIGILVSLTLTAVTLVANLVHP